MKTTFWKTLLALLLVLLMICGLLSGCAGNLNAEDTTASATENTDASETASDDEKIHLRKNHMNDLLCHIQIYLFLMKLEIRFPFQHIC